VQKSKGKQVDSQVKMFVTKVLLLTLCVCAISALPFGFEDVQPDDLVAVESAPLDYIQTDDDDTVVVDLTRAKRHGGYGELTC